MDVRRYLNELEENHSNRIPRTFSLISRSPEIQSHERDRD